MAEPANAPTQVISLPKGGGAIKSIGETFQPNLIMGSGDFAIPIVTSDGRNGFGPTLSLEYSAGNGNGPFGLGWQLSIPRIARKTERGIPRYTPADLFVLSGAEDLVPWLQSSVDAVTGEIVWQPVGSVARGGYRVSRYRPRVEGLFARIEQWVDAAGDVHWRTTTRDNTTSIYGKTQAARVVNPNDPSQVFEWLLQETFDAKGNHILYEYAQDNPNVIAQSISEQNRVYAQRYIRRIYYGNSRQAVGPKKVATDHNNPLNSRERRYCFELLFDYGDLPPNPEDMADGTEDGWQPRPDPFSMYRAGFEVRTMRRCERVVMLHHFAEVGASAWVKSTDFQYLVNADTSLSLLASATVVGYRREGNAYRRSSLPPVTFAYSKFEAQQQRYQSIAANRNAPPPLALRHRDMTLVDLFGRGLPDLLHSTSRGYLYWRNLGNGRFDQPRLMAQSPAGVLLSQPGVAFADLGGDGHAELLVTQAELNGFFETTASGEWANFRPLPTVPTFDLSDPNTRLIDLTGNGLTDVLVTRDHHFLWYESLGEEGYAPAQIIERTHDLDEFPDVYFAENAARIRLADMNGDGLQDIVMIHNGRMEYWPNVGYGRFGKRVTMSNAPRLGADFDLTRLFLADLDGSGCADLVYVEYNQLRFWFNCNGNGWSNEQRIYGTPVTAQDADLRFADFFGTGTTALIWSNDFNNQPRGNYKVLDFCGGVKPYLLVEMDNHMGATTRVEYASSTHFYLQDEANGEPWVTQLSFPVQVIAKVEIIDHVSRTKLVTTYKYHHGYYDGREREFRGFGRVDRFDTEYLNDFAGPGLHGSATLFNNAGAAYHTPPVETRTWFHTGIYYDQNAPSRFFDFDDLEEAYRQEYYAGDAQSLALSDHDVDASSVPFEAYRALQGSMLRSEIYARDGTNRANHPYQVTENRYRVRQLQPKESNAHAVFHTTPRENVTYKYEREPTDPRVVHILNLRVDNFGNITDSVTVGYPRRVVPVELPEQGQEKILYTHTDFINATAAPENYHIGIPYQIRNYEVSGLRQPSYQEADFGPLLNDPDDFIQYHSAPAAGVLQKRIVEWTRTYFRADARANVIDPPQQATRRLNLGSIERLALPYESYRAALTNAQITQIYGQDAAGNNRVTAAMLQQGGYVAFNDAANTWWMPGGRAGYDAGAYYLSTRFQDAFGNISRTSYDDYDLLIEQTTDALNNTMGAVNNYRTMLPETITDANGNRSQVAFDALGMVVGTALMGKAAPAAVEGDTLQGFQADLTQAQIDGFFDAADPHLPATALLMDATTRIVYDAHCFWRSQQAHPADPTKWRPVYAAVLAREIHVSDLQAGQALKIQLSFSYCDGFGREIQSKKQAEAGSIQQGGAEINPRWVCSGWTLYNNRGKPVRQYEPFFDDTHHFKFGNMVGVSPVLFYDAVERVIAKLHPNHTYEKVIFAAWKEISYDVNDTVAAAGMQTGDPRTDPEIGAFVAEYFRTLPVNWQTWYAQRVNDQLGAAEGDAARKASAHADTPAVAHFDALGRPYLSVAQNRSTRNGAVVNESYEIHFERDIENNQTRVIDAKDRIIVEYDYDMLSNVIHHSSMEAGERWALMDVTGNPLYTWDSRGFIRRMSYDNLRRPTALYVTENGVERLAEVTRYGEGQGRARNHRGRVYQLMDSAGIVTQVEYDFKGNVKENRRDLLPPPFHKVDVDWSRAPSTNGGRYQIRSGYDALNRPTFIQSPDSSIYYPTFNEANLLDKVDVQVRASAAITSFISKIAYNAKGQQSRIVFGNGGVTTYEYEATTFRLIRLRSTRPARRNQQAQIFVDGRVVQDLLFTYDPIGNITRLEDAAMRPIFYNNQLITPVSDYTYDAINRMVEAQGREHIGQAAFRFNPPDGNYRDHPFAGVNAHVNNIQALRRYTQSFEYDEVGNFTEVYHVANGDNWRLRYEYQEASQIEAGKSSNRLSRTRLAHQQNYIQNYRHDEHGNMIAMPHLPVLRWNFEDQLRATSEQVRNNGVAETTYYLYDSSGERVRKVTENQNGNRVKERIYLGGFEIYRQYSGNGQTVTVERESLHVMADTHRIALVETQTIQNGARIGAPRPQLRYQIVNHLLSTTIELAEDAAFISLQEYHSFGTVALQVGRSVADVKYSRYRHVGKERDEESGFDYYGARYYAAWLGRWTSCDPDGLEEGINLYLYVSANPLRFIDVAGTKVRDTVGGCYVALVDTILMIEQSNSDMFLKSDEWKRSYDRCRWGDKIRDSEIAKETRKDVASNKVASKVVGATLGIISVAHPNAPDGSDLDPAFQESYTEFQFASNAATMIVGNVKTLGSLKSFTPPPGPPSAMAPALVTNRAVSTATATSASVASSSTASIPKPANPIPVTTAPTRMKATGPGSTPAKPAPAKAAPAKAAPAPKTPKGYMTREERWVQLANEPNTRLSKEVVDHINRTGGRGVQEKFGLELAHPPKRSSAQGYDYSEATPKTMADHRGIQHRYLQERASGTTINAKEIKPRYGGKLDVPLPGKLP